MQWYEVLIIVAAATFVIGVIAWRIYLRVHKKAGCSCCDCAHCAGCSECTKTEAAKDEK